MYNTIDPRFRRFFDGSVSKMIKKRSFLPIMDKPKLKNIIFLFLKEFFSA